MLDYIRRNSDSAGVKIILGVLSLTFILFFGSSTLFADRTEVVAEVNGEVIRDMEIQQAVRRQVNFARQFNPSGQEPDIERIQQQVLDATIDQRLQLQAAKEMGFIVSDKELRRAILEHPSFQDDNGKFDREKYEKLAGYKGSSFERDLREDLLLQAARDFIRRSVRVSDSEIRQAFEEDASKRSVSFIRVPTSLFADEVEITDDEVTAWAAEHEQEITDRFDRDFETKYDQPKQVKAAHILMKIDEDASDEEKDEVRAKMEQVLTEAKASGADFAALARKYSEDGSAPRGGDLGFFDETRMVKPFSDTAFAMKAGEISDLVETRFGIHVIKVEEVKEAETKTLDMVKSEIARELLAEEKAPELAKAHAATLTGVLDGSVTGEAANELLGERSLTVQESGEFSRKDRRVPKLGTSADALAAAFALEKEGAVSEPVDVGTGYAILRLDGKTEVDDSTFASKKDELRGQLLRTKQVRAVQAWQDQLKADAKILVRAGA